MAVRDLCVKSPGGEVLVEEGKLALTNQTRAGFVGANGSGKSTILNVLRGSATEASFSGEIEIASKGLVVEKVAQFPAEEELDLTAEELVLSSLRNRFGDLAEDWKGYAVLSRLGLEGKSLDTKLRDLSGGEINIALFAKAMALEPSLLLLDEPTNHLDTEGIHRFERMLDRVTVPFVMVSHDRELLDRFTKQTFFLSHQRITRIDLPYSDAKVELQKQREALEDLHRQQERRRDQIARRVAWLQRLAAVSEDMAKVYRAHCSKLARYESDMIELTQERKKNISLNAVDIRAPVAIKVDRLAVTVPQVGRHLFSIDSLSISPGERVAIMGPNGAGKTTLLDRIVRAYRDGEEPVPGEPGVRINPQVKLGYYDQKQTEIQSSETLIGYLQKQNRIATAVAHKALVAAGFPYDRHHGSLGQLSGGERARLQLLAMNQAGVNLIILDEPTNHLDVQGIEQLEERMQDFTGAVVFVSHDRRFLENIGTTFYLIQEGKLELVAGPETYYDYLDTLKNSSPPDEVDPGHERPGVPGKTGDRPETVLSEDPYERWCQLEAERERHPEGSKAHQRLTREIEVLERNLFH